MRNETAIDWGEKMVEHLELSGFEIDEQERVTRKKDGGRGWQ